MARPAAELGRWPQRAKRWEDARVSEPLFPEGVRASMRMDTSSRWAADLTADDLPALIWMVGEFGRRAGHVLAALDEQ